MRVACMAHCAESTVNSVSHPPAFIHLHQPHSSFGSGDASVVVIRSSGSLREPESDERYSFHSFGVLLLFSTKWATTASPPSRGLLALAAPWKRLFSASRCELNASPSPRKVVAENPRPVVGNGEPRNHVQAPLQRHCFA